MEGWCQATNQSVRDWWWCLNEDQAYVCRHLDANGSKGDGIIIVN